MFIPAATTARKRKGRGGGKSKRPVRRPASCETERKSFLLATTTANQTDSAEQSQHHERDARRFRNCRRIDQAITSRIIRRCAEQNCAALRCRTYAVLGTKHIAYVHDRRG